MDFWNLMFKKEDWIYATAMYMRQLKVWLNPKLCSVNRKMKKKPLMGTGRELYLLLNAPSLMEQDLSVLIGKDCMFVNRGFMHPMYKELKPKYHVFADPKMIKGIWPVSWIEDILKMSPDTLIILPLAWYNNPMFQPYHSHIYWMDHNYLQYGLAVSGWCFRFAVKQNYRKIYFAGYDGTANAHEMLKSANSHFYGRDDEQVGKSTDTMATDLWMFARRLHDLNRFSRYCNRKGIEIVNVTHGGLLDMFERESLLPLKGKSN